MPKQLQPLKSVEQIADEVGMYAVEAYYFVQQGLALTAECLHGEKKAGKRHISGQELAEGLRDIAIKQWGMLARTVLERWGICSTLDFGRIVYAMIDAGMMARTVEDTLDDFKNVYDFRKSFEHTYKIEPAKV